MVYTEKRVKRGLEMFRKFLDMLEKPQESKLVLRNVDGTPQMIHKDTVELLEKDFLRPTPANPQIGVCKTCAPDRIKFLNELRDLENDQSCFMLAHEVEPLAGLPWAMTEEGKAEARAEFERIEYEAWRAGQLDL